MAERWENRRKTIEEKVFTHEDLIKSHNVSVERDDKILQRQKASVQQYKEELLQQIKYKRMKDDVDRLERGMLQSTPSKTNIDSSPRSEYNPIPLTNANSRTYPSKYIYIYIYIDTRPLTPIADNVERGEGSESQSNYTDIDLDSEEEKEYINNKLGQDSIDVIHEYFGKLTNSPTQKKKKNIVNSPIKNKISSESKKQKHQRVLSNDYAITRNREIENSNKESASNLSMDEKLKRYLERHKEKSEMLNKKVEAYQKRMNKVKEMEDNVSVLSGVTGVTGRSNKSHYSIAKLKAAIPKKIIIKKVNHKKNTKSTVTEIDLLPNINERSPNRGGDSTRQKASNRLHGGSELKARQKYKTIEDDEVRSIQNFIQGRNIHKLSNSDIQTLDATNLRTHSKDLNQYKTNTLDTSLHNDLYIKISDFADLTTAKTSTKVQQIANDRVLMDLRNKV